MAIDRPTAAELLGAVERFLREQLVPELRGYFGFQARVAANALAIARREIEQLPAAAEREHRGLRELLGRDGSLPELNRELCRRIRSRELGPDSAALMRHLRETTLAKVAIDQPGYSAFRRATGGNSAPGPGGDPHA